MGRMIWAIALSLPAALGSNLIGDEIEDGYLPMPGGVMVHRDCIHHHEDAFLVQELPNNATSVGENIYPECPHPMKRNAQSAPNYYSDWVAYASAANPKSGYSFMSSKWKVPSAPKSHGPLGLSSIYIFNGLEDGSGHHGASSFIMQPVLSFGKSGCVINPLNYGRWNFLSFYVSNSGRAHCGPRIPVKEGDLLYGAMEKVEGEEKNTWDVISTLLSTNKTSTYRAVLEDAVVVDAAYITIEAMILYSCNAYPAGNVTFTENMLTAAVTKERFHNKGISWKPVVRHSECDQGVQFSPNGDVTLIYDPTKNN